MRLTNGLRLGLKRDAVAMLAGQSPTSSQEAVRYSEVDSSRVAPDAVSGEAHGERITVYHYRGWEVQFQDGVVVRVLAWARSET